MNKRIKWQIDNIDRGINCVGIDLYRTGLFVFVDGSFANNQDLSSQIGYVICLANEVKFNSDNPYSKIRGNIIHWSSTKCKRVTRSVLASEIYGMVQGFDMGYCIMKTLNMIVAVLNKLRGVTKIPSIPLILCTDSYSLYEGVTKLGTTAEKRLMIDLMALRQSYEAKEITEIRWIHGDDNPADGMTKS